MLAMGVGGTDRGLNMETFHLRDAVLDDSPSIARIYEHYVRTTCFTFEEVPPTSDEIRGRMSKTEEAGLPYVVAEGTDASVIGYAYASAFHPRSAYRYSLENSVYVAADRTGQGIGTALMEHLIGRCTALGYRQIVALIGDRENGTSFRLHTRLGFKPVGNLAAIGLKFNRWVDVFEMQLALGEGRASIPAADPGKPAI
jgi:L-amino acid N-acyltransferase YncA